jgi:hypothetical protein
MQPVQCRVHVVLRPPVRVPDDDIFESKEPLDDSSGALFDDEADVGDTAAAICSKVPSQDRVDRIRTRRAARKANTLGVGRGEIDVTTSAGSDSDNPLAGDDETMEVE